MRTQKNHISQKYSSRVCIISPKGIGWEMRRRRILESERHQSISVLMHCASRQPSPDDRKVQTATVALAGMLPSEPLAYTGDSLRRHGGTASWLYVTLNCCEASPLESCCCFRRRIHMCFDSSIEVRATHRTVPRHHGLFLKVS